MASCRVFSRRNVASSILRLFRVVLPWCQTTVEGSVWSPSSCITSPAKYRLLRISKPPVPRAPNLPVYVLLYLTSLSIPVSSLVYTFPRPRNL
ncbi:hypothetical protein ARMSODRAFT_967582 [Armillaria solidipes]|uniref:Uncharacterized protein n=1 Tax=Armillaria solidipes TaxID=1076256 RepID=A0A2H3APD8_9AGAR|nr:hypothetical protein ARMSODRAFT_967582 [Armillaria solidipes]